VGNDNYHEEKWGTTLVHNS